MRVLRSLLVASGAVASVSGEDVFKKVVTALEDALADAKSAQKTNDDEFAKVQCKAQELIDEANERIPKHTDKIAVSKARQQELRSDNEAKSIEAADLDASVARNTKMLADKQTKRDDENKAYKIKKGDMENGVDMMKKAIGTLTDGTANLLQVEEMHGSPVERVRDVASQIALMQQQSKTGTSGQIIGLLKSMKDTFESDLATMAAEEAEAARLFKEYKERTEAQIKSETKLSESHKKDIAANVSELQTVQQTLKDNIRMLDEMETQLADETALLKENTQYHDRITAESAALQSAIANAVELLTSDAALKTMKKVDTIKKVSMPTFVQTSLLSKKPADKSLILAEALRKKAAGEYGWGAIYEAIDDMTKALKDSIAEAEDKKATCEGQMRTHLANEEDLKNKKLKWSTEKTSQEDIIEDAEDNIKDMNDEIKKRNLEIQTTTTAIREEEAATQKETKETNDAHALFVQAINFLKEYEAVDVEGPKTGKGAFDSSTLSTGTDKVVAIVQKVDDDMMKELKDMIEQSEKTVGEYQDKIANAKKVIEESDKSLADSKEALVDATRALENAEHWLLAANKGLAAEAEWWGPAPGNKMPSPGEDCISFLGASEVYNARDSYKAVNPKDASGEPTEIKQDNGEYHKLTKSAKDEIDALNGMMKTIKDLETDYLVPQGTF